MTTDPTPSCLCPDCGGEAPPDASTCPRCSTSLLLHGRYRLRTVLGQNVGITYLADDTASGVEVVVKELSIQSLESWKHADLFGREVAILKQLDHDRIPDYVDSFSEGEGKRQVHYLVQECMAGVPLDQELEHKRYRVEEVLDVMEGVLDVLDYLHGLSPPVIHRDIKPSNLMRMDDGSVGLIDFGAVKDVFKPRGSGETVAGTFGYMAPEQFRGEALPQSDYYALGVVALELLSRQRPDDLVGDDMRLDWEGTIHVAPPVRRLLRTFLAQSPDDRPSTAAQARRLVTKAREELAAESQAASAPRPHPQVTTTPLDDPTGVPPGEIVAKTPMARGVGIFIGVSSLVILVAIMIGIASSGSPQKEAKQERVYADLPTCQPGACEPVPEGIKGLSFGMTKQQVLEVLPATGFATEAPLPSVSNNFGSSLVMGGGYEIALVTPEGFQLEVPTTIGDLEATCTLSFAVERTLSKIYCEFAPLSTQESHRAVEQTIVGKLLEKYGPPTSVSDNPPEFGFEITKIDRSWTWKSSKATLLVTSKYESFDSSMGIAGASGLLGDNSFLRLTNTSTAHEQVMQGYEDQAEAIAAKKEQEAATKATIKHNQELEKTKHSSEKLGDEL